MNYQLGFLVSLFGLFSFILTDPTVPEMMTKCESEIGITREEVLKFNTTRPVETNDQKIKCYLKCLLMEAKWMSPEGNIQLGNIYPDAQQYQEFVPACMDVQADDACEKAFKFHKCIVDKKEGN